MKNKILVFTILFVMFLFPFVVLGQPAYERNPSGSEIENPVSFTLTDVFTTYPACNSWQLTLTPTATTSQCATLTTDTWEVSLPLGEYTYLNGKCFSDAGCSSLEETWDVEGSDDPSVIFEVVAPPPPYEGNIVTITTSSVASTTAYIGDLINSVGPFLWLIIGLPLGFWIINETIKFITPKKVKIKK